MRLHIIATLKINLYPLLDFGSEAPNEDKGFFNLILWERN